jgi:hypothetical protein
MVKMEAKMKAKISFSTERTELNSDLYKSEWGNGEEGRRSEPG